MTVIWWDDLWLNEGFASYMEFKGADYCEPSWDMVSTNEFLVLRFHFVLI